MASFYLKFGNLLCSHPQLVGVLSWFATISFYVELLFTRKDECFCVLCMGLKTFGKYFWYRFVYQNRFSLRITLKENRIRKRYDLFCCFYIFFWCFNTLGKVLMTFFFFFLFLL